MAEVVVNFQSKGDEEVLEAVRKVTKNVGDLKRIAKTPIDLKIAKDSMAADDFAKVKRTVLSAKDATKDWAKETEKLWREQQKLATAAERAARATKSVSMGGITGSMMGGGGGRGSGGGGAPFPLGNPMAGPNPAAFSTKAVNELNKSLGLTAEKAKAAGFQLGFVARIVAAMGIRAAVREVFQLADAYTNLQNKLRVTVGADSLGFISKEIFQIAQNSRMSLESVATVFSRTTRSVKALGKSQQEVLVFTDALSKAIAVGGSTSVEASNAMIQLSQGMGSGALRGDELRSVLEQLPVVAELIADRMGVPIAALRKLGAAGAITTDVIFDAISSKSEELTAKMKSMQLTVGQAWTMLKNQATMSSAAMQGVMNSLANTIQFVTNNFDAFVTAALMLGAALTAGGVIKAIMAATEASKALALVWKGHPLLTAAAGIVLVTSLLAPLVSKLRLASDHTVTFGDIWSATWDEIKEDVMGSEGANGIEEMDKAMVGLSESTRGYAMYLATVFDVITNSIPIVHELKRAFAWMVDADSDNLFRNKTEKILNRAEQDAQFKETERLINENKDILAEDLSLDGGISEEDQIAKALDREREGLLKYAEVLEDIERREKKNRGHKESGKTLEELLREATFTESTSRLGDIEEKVKERYHKMIESLKPSIQNALETGRSKALNEQARALESLIKTEIEREEQEKSMLERQKAINKATEEGIKAAKELADARRKMIEDTADRQMSRFDSLRTTAGNLSPNLGIRDQIIELEKFRDFANQNNLADWAETATQEIESLHRALKFGLDPLKEWENQMKSIFGPGGTLVKGFADAAANAIVMSQSLGDLKRAIVDVLTSVQKQMLSSLIQLPLNIAMGALTNSIGGGPNYFGAAVEGARAVDASEASSWGFASGGYTGNMGINTPAGIVHGQEFVLNADATRRMGRQNLEMINKGGTPVSAGSEPPVINIHNNAGVQVEAHAVSPGQVEVMISKALRDQAGKVIAGQINDPNSMVSRSLSKSLSAERRRI